MASFPGGYPGYASGPQHGSGGNHAHGAHGGHYNALNGNGASYVPHEYQHMHPTNQATPAPYVYAHAPTETVPKVKKSPVVIAIGTTTRAYGWGPLDPQRGPHTPRTTRASSALT
jgi:hypothetical protein